MYPLKTSRPIVETKRWNNERHSYRVSLAVNAVIIMFRNFPDFDRLWNALCLKGDHNMYFEMLSLSRYLLKIFFTVICSYLRSEWRISPKGTNTGEDKR